MANTIIPKRSSVAGKVPLSTDLQVGEIAVNLADGLIFSKNAGGTVITLGGGSGGSSLPAQTGNAGKYLTTDGTTASWGSITSGNVTTALGFTPANKAGDTFTGKLTLPAPTATVASLNIGQNTADPSSLVNGDIWINSASSMKYRLGGTTYTLPTINGANSFTAVNTFSNTVQVTGALQFYGASGVNADFGSSVVTGIVTVGSTSQTGATNIAPSIATNTISIGSGATTAVSTKTINLGGNGVSGSTTNINIGSSVSGATTNIASVGSWNHTGSGAVNSGATGYAFYWGSTGTNSYVLGSFVGGGYLANSTTGNQHFTMLDSGETLIRGAGAEAIRINASKAIGLNGANYGVVNEVMVSQGSAAAPIWQGLKTVNGTSILGAGNITLTETDPVFSASASASITTTNISNWNTAFGWGNHASAGYLTSATAASTYQPLDGDLTAIAALAGTTGLLRKTAANTWTLDTTAYGTGTVTSVGGTGTVSGLTLSGTVTASGNLTLGGTLAVTPSNFASQTANTVLAAPNGTAGVPTFRTLVAADIPALSYAPTAGSTSITTLGTVTSGTWNATVISSSFGGTGVNNGGRTLAINTNSGTLAFTNAATTLTVANTASVSGTNTGDQTIALTGDVTGTGTGSFATTLATVNANVGTFTNATVTVDAKGRVTAVSSGSGGGGVTSFNTRTGAVTLSSSDVTTALGYTPYNSTNPSGYITADGNARIGVENNGTLVGTRRAINFIPGTGISLSITDDAANEEVDVTITSTVTGGVTSFNTRTGAVTLSSSDVTTALGYTPYNSTNPNGYTSNTGTVTSVSGTGTVSGLTLTGSVTSSGSLTLGGSITLPVSGNWFRGFGAIDANGFMEVGRYIDFHATNATTAEYDVRLDCTASGALSLLGSLTASGNITAFSDERLKTDWADLGADFIERLAAVKNGTYTRIDTGMRQIGVSAQSLLPVAPDGVMDGEFLSVAYGNVALAASVELAKEAVDLRKQVARQESRIKRLESLVEKLIGE